MAARVPIELSASGLESTLVTRLPMVPTCTGTRSMWWQDFKPNVHLAVSVSHERYVTMCMGGSISPLRSLARSV